VPVMSSLIGSQCRLLSSLQCASAVIFLMCSAAPARLLCAHDRFAARQHEKARRSRDFVFSMESRAVGHGEAVASSCATVLWSESCLVV
jgi:hypothetical protein